MKKIINILYHNKIIFIIPVIIFILLFSLLGETNAEKMERIKREIEVAKSNNISYAKNEIKKLNVSIKELESQLNKKKSDKYIYEKCIKQNKIQDLPVNCRDVTISLKDSLGWEVNSNGMSQEYKQLLGDTPKQRAEYMLNSFEKAKGTIDLWLELGEKYKIDPYLAISIAKADSSLGNQLKSTNNFGNVGNNDRGDVVHYATKQDGIEAIFRVLNNKYLGNIYTVGYLSCGGKIKLGIENCFQNNEKVYATSKENWNNNVINTLRNIYKDSSIDENYNFRK